MKKRIIAFLTAFGIMLSSVIALPEEIEWFITGITASVATYSDYEYTSLIDGTIEISKYNGSDTNVVIPDMINNRKVTRIGNSCFSYNKSIESVTIPNSVDEICSRAFSNCLSLKRIKMPKKLIYIGERAFECCSSLTSLNISYGIKKIPAYMCWKCESLKNVNLPNTLEYIEDSSFYFTNLEEIFIPDTVKSIGTYAFGLKIHYISIPANTVFHSGGWFGMNNSFLTYGVGYKPKITYRTVVPNENINENGNIVYSYKGASDEKSHNYSFNYCDDLFLEDANNENLDIAQMSVGLAMAAYDITTTYSCLISQMGFELKELVNYNHIPTYDNNDTVAYTIAHKKINGYDVYVVPIRGTYGNCEWFSDFNLGTGSDHLGFKKAADNVEEKLKEYFAADKIDSNKTIVLFTGHSRGAAVANILAGRFSKNNIEINGKIVQIPNENIFGYTFACPAVSKNADTSLKNIYNYNNPGDLITAVPLNDWGFKRNGIDKPLYTINSQNAFKHCFYNHTGLKYSGNNDTKDFIKALKQLAPKQSDFNSKDNQIIFGIIAITQMENENLPSEQKKTYMILSLFKDNYQINLVEKVLRKTVLDLMAKPIISKYLFGNDITYDSIINSGHMLAFTPAIIHGHTGETYISGIEALKNNNVTAHKYKTKTVAPTYTAQGYTQHTCSVCGDSYKDNYKAKLTRTSLAKSTVTGIANKYYTGKSITQSPVVKLGNMTLKKGTDYTVTFKNNKAVGTATVTIKGKGNYTGSISKTFKINPKKTTLKSATSPKTKQLKVTYSKVSGVTGYQITYATSSDFKTGKKNVNATGTSKTISGLTKGKTYYVKVRTYKTVKGTKYYSGYSAVKKIKIK